MQYLAIYTGKRLFENLKTTSLLFIKEIMRN